jgi:Xaa-Pro dipeptidase
MTIGVGGSTAEKELAAMTSMRGDVPPIGVEERLKRIGRARTIMREKGIDALYLDVSSSMVYFAGLNFRRTERMHSAVPTRAEALRRIAARALKIKEEKADKPAKGGTRS